jgi:N-glycosylase/DNA lyase
MEIAIDTPTDFNFKRTALSHGWATLLPFELDEEHWVLTRVFDVGNLRPVIASISGAGSGLLVATSEKLGRSAAESLTKQVKHIMRLDDPMGPFYEMMSGEEGFEWVSGCGAGRMLRSPSVYEDLVKTICTTNCSWALTVKMVTSLVDKLGVLARDGRKTFPTPAVMAEQTESFYREEIRAGYRAGYLRELAERVASGELNVEQWLELDLPTVELKKLIKEVKGVGDYAADNLLKLLGRYDGLALDSWLRAQFAKTHNRGRKATDKKIERHYARFKEWRGLAIWCDMTRGWIESE